MLSSYQFAERYNAQSFLWDACGLILAGVRKTAAIVGRCFAIVSHFLPLLLLALGLTLGIAVVAAAVAMIPLTFWLGLVTPHGHRTSYKIRLLSTTMLK